MLNTVYLVSIMHHACNEREDILYVGHGPRTLLGGPDTTVPEPGQGGTGGVPPSSPAVLRSWSSHDTSQRDPPVIGILHAVILQAR